MPSLHQPLCLIICRKSLMPIIVENYFQQLQLSNSTPNSLKGIPTLILDGHPFKKEVKFLWPLLLEYFLSIWLEKKQQGFLRQRNFFRRFLGETIVTTWCKNYSLFCNYSNKPPLFASLAMTNFFLIFHVVNEICLLLR